MQFKKILILTIITALVLPVASFASETNGTIDSVNKYAWSNQIGWLNFKTTNGDIKISDSGITGYVWNSNYGWINMSPTNGGVSVTANGSLSGYAWGTNLGWVDFSGASINSSGKFVGSATGSVIGTLTFDCTNCNVSTDYRPKNFRASTQVLSNKHVGSISPIIIPPTTPIPTRIVPTTITATLVNNPTKLLHESGGNVSGIASAKILPSKLFDIRLLLDSSSVIKSEYMVSRVTFVSFGKVPTLVNMFFSVFDKNGKVIWKKAATTTIQTEGVYTKRLPALNLPVGKYTLRLHTQYSKTVEDEFTATFQIISEEKSFNWLVWSAGILAVLIFLIYVIKIIRNKIIGNGITKDLKIP